MPIKDQLRNWWQQRGLPRVPREIRERERQRLAPKPHEGKGYNVGQIVRAGPSGATMEFDQRRRPMNGLFVVPPNTLGIVKGVDPQSNPPRLFIDVAVRSPHSQWQVEGAPPNHWTKSDPGDHFHGGQKVRAIGDIATNYGVVPHGTRGEVTSASDDTVDVQFVGWYPMDQWVSQQPRNVWGFLRVAAACPVKSVSYARTPSRAPSMRAPGKNERRRRVFQEIWYLKQGNSVAVPQHCANEDYRACTLRPGANVLDVSEATLAKYRDQQRRTASAEDPRFEALLAAVTSQAASVERLTKMVEKLMGDAKPNGGYDAIRTEDRLIVLDPKVLEQEQDPKRRRWMQASKHASDEFTIDWHGLEVAVEAPANTTRHPDSKYPSYTVAHYGYIVDTEAVDGDGVDILLGGQDNGMVYLAVQTEPDSDEFRQFKVLADFPSKAAAEAALRTMWPEDMLGETYEVPLDEFLNVVLPKIDLSAGMLRVTERVRIASLTNWSERVAAYGMWKAAGRLEQIKAKYPELDQAGVIDQLAEADPSGNNKYLGWAAKQLAGALERKKTYHANEPNPGTTYTLTEGLPVQRSMNRRNVTAPAGSQLTITHDGGHFIAFDVVDGPFNYNATTAQEKFQEALADGTIKPDNPGEAPSVEELKTDYDWDLTERATRMGSIIKQFHEQLPRVKKKDINQYSDSGEVWQAVLDAQERAKKKEDRAKAKEGAEKLFETDDYMVYKITNMQASCFYGAGTKWCITAKENNMYQNYIDVGAEFYFVINKAVDEATDRQNKWAIAHYPEGSTETTPDDDNIPPGGVRVFDAADDKVGVRALPGGESIPNQLFGAGNWNEDKGESDSFEDYIIAYYAVPEGEGDGVDDAVAIDDDLDSLVQHLNQDVHNGYEIYETQIHEEDFHQFTPGRGFDYHTENGVLVRELEAPTDYMIALVSDLDTPQKWSVADVERWFMSEQQAAQATQGQTGYALWRVELTEYDIQNTEEEDWLMASRDIEEIKKVPDVDAQHQQQPVTTLTPAQPDQQEHKFVGFLRVRAYQKGIGVISSDNLVRLGDDLRDRGYEPVLIDGTWKGKSEQSLRVDDIDRADLIDLGNRHNQEAVSFDGRLIRLANIPTLATWLLTNPQAWQVAASSYPMFKDLWAKFQNGQATMADAQQAIQSVGEQAMQVLRDGNPTPAEEGGMRMVGWVRVGAGVVDLKGLDRVLTDKLTDSEDPMLRGKIGDYTDQQILDNPEADARFKAISLMTTFRGDNQFGIDPSGGHQWIQFGLSKLINDDLPAGRRYNKALSTVTHELRHAADWAYNPKQPAFQRSTLQRDITDPDEQKSQYVNNPTELKSWAGNVADALWQMHGAQALQLGGAGIMSAVKEYYPTLLEYIHEPNRKEFLQRVLKALEQRVNEQQQRAGMRSRLPFEDELRTQGELAFDQLRVGDRVRFDADFDKPGWPRVDAGSFGTLTAIDRGRRMVYVETPTRRATENGGMRHSVQILELEPDNMTLMVNSKDPRLTAYRVED